MPQFEPGNDAGKEHRFKPGQSGNPAGKPKGTMSLTANLRALMEKEIDVVDPITKEPGKKKIGEVINLRLIANSIKGDARSIKIVQERLEGKPKQEVDVNAKVTTMDKIKRDGKEMDFNVGDQKPVEEPE